MAKQQYQGTYTNAFLTAVETGFWDEKKLELGKGYIEEIRERTGQSDYGQEDYESFTEALSILEQKK